MLKSFLREPAGRGISRVPRTIVFDSSNLRSVVGNIDTGMADLAGFAHPSPTIFLANGDGRTGEACVGEVSRLYVSARQTGWSSPLPLIFAGSDSDSGLFGVCGIKHSQ